jgi:hypothetical protein
MGYESRFYIVNKLGSYGEKIAVFNMCKVPKLYNVIKDYPKTDIFIYADDGDTHITEDCYGKPLIEIPVNDMIYHLRNVIEHDIHYRRYKPFLRMLLSFDTPEWENLVVLHYGY